MKHLNFLSKSGSRSCGHRVTTLASTVGSPSAHRRGAMLRLISVLVLVLTFGVGNVWGTEEVIYTLEPANGSNNSYGGNCDVEIDDITWNVSGNSQQIPWRLGGKSISNTDRAIYSKTAISDNVTKIVVTHGAASSITVNSMTVIVSTAQNGGGTVTSTLTPTFSANNDVTIERPDGKDWSGKFYKIVYNVTVSGDKNKFLEFAKAEFYKEVSCNPLAAPGSPSSTPHAESVDLSWNSVSGATGYLVTFNGTEYNIASGTTTKTISGLSMETEYHWTVAAKGDGTTNCAVGTATAEQTVTTLDDCTGEKATYSVTSKTTVSSTNAPSGSSATFDNNGTNNNDQMTSGKRMLLTLSGYEGYIIKSIKLSMRSNGSGGAGNFSAVAGTTTISSISTAAFNSASWNGAYTTSYVTIVPTMSNDGYTIKKDENVVITIAATANSLYCESFSICYEEGCTELGSINGSVSVTNDGTSVTVKDWTYTKGSAAAESNISTYDVYLYSDADNYADPVDTKTCAYNATSTGVTFTGLSYARTYKFKIGATGKTNYCDIEPVQVTTINTTSTQTYQLPCVDAGLAYGTAEVVKTFGNDDFTNTLTNSHNLNVSYEVLNASPSGCVTVNNAGLVHIVSAGTATIKATSAEQTVNNVKYCTDNASYALTVNKADISPSLLYASTSLTAGGTSASPTITGNAGNGTVSYAVTAANPTGCATVNETTGVVTAVAAGSATITATIGATTNYNGNTATANFTISAASQCVAPTFSVNTGTYVGSQNVTISSTSGATIYYTTDGSDPTSSGTRSTYSSAIPVGVTTTIRAYAEKSGMSDSEEGSATITIKCAAPTFSVEEDIYNSAQSVEITTTYGTDIYYTTDESTPTTESTKYTGAISVGTTQTIKAITVKEGCSASEVAEIYYIIQCAAPTFSLDEGTYNENQTVTISKTYGDKIYYTLDGNDPTTGSTEYTGAITIDATKTLKAIVWKSGCENSNITSANYTLKCATPTFSVAAGTHTGAQNVELSCATDGAAIHYTTNGNDPTGSSPTYSEAITVSSAQTIKAIATKSGWSNSDIAEAAYTIQYAVKWYVGGTEEANVVQTTYVTAGSKVAPIADRDGDAIGTCATDFMGWTTEALRNGSVPQTADHYYTTLFKYETASASLPTITENSSYYAVFAKNGGQVETNNYAKITSTTDLADGMKFVLVAVGTESDKNGTYPFSVMMNNTVNSSNVIGKNDVTVSENSVTLTNGDAGCVYTLEKNGNVYKIKDKDGKYIYRPTTANKIGLTATASVAREFAISFTDGNASIVIENGNTTDSLISYNNNKGSSERFSIYKTQQQPVMIFKVQTEQGYSDYVTECAAVEAPTFSVAAGTYNEAQSVELSCATENATIRYTTDGNAPSKTSGTVYNNTAITIDQSMTLKAIAYKGDDVSDVAEAAYVLKVATPEISGNTNFVNSATVTITAADGTSIYYTTNGVDPTTESTPYTAPFTVDADGTTTVKAIAVKAGWTSSEIASQAFTKITPKTVAEANTAIAALSANGTIANQYVKGLISQIDKFNDDNTITYYISDNGTTASQLQVYHGSAGVANGGNAFTAKENLQLGEEVIVSGTLKKFEKSTNNYVYEFVNPNAIVAYKTHSPIAWSANAYTAELGGSENEFPTLSGTTGLTISYSSSDETVATISGDGTTYDLKKTGETTITATSAATDDFVATTKSYTLTVSPTVIRVDLDIDCNGATSGCPETTHLVKQTSLPNPLPEVTKTGKNFGGWYTDNTFETPAVAGASITENTTIYAQWLEPYTVARALEIIGGLDDNEKTADNVYVAGVVTADAVSIDNNNTATYKIKDATVNNSLEVYKGKGLNDADVAVGDLQEGDQVVVYGQLMKYKGYNSTAKPEIVNPNHLYSKVRPTFDVTGVSVSPTSTNTRVGRTVELTKTIQPANASDKAVTWSSDAEGVATVDENGVVTGVAEGTAHITVTTHDGGFQATCTVTVAGALPSFTEDDHEWIKITNASKLVAGRFYVIAESASGRTATTSISGSVMAPVASTFSADKSVIASGKLGTNTAIFELGGNTADGWTLYEVTDEENTGYFSGVDASNFGWSESEAVTPISFTEDGKAILGNASGYRLLYNTNNGNPRFKTYNSSLSNSMLLPQLYMWAELSHSVTFDANGGVAESVPGVERTDEGKIIIPATTPTHSDISKAFGGWYKSDAPSVLYNAGDEFETNVDVTLYAKWNTVPTYTVTYVPGGQGTVPAVASYRAGQKVQVEEASLSNPGYSFAGWTVKDADQNVLPLDEENKFEMPASAVTITATWSRISNQKWALVKQGDELVIDAEYVIAYNSNTFQKALGAISSNIGTAINVTIDGDYLKGSEAMKVLTLKAGNGGSNYAFKDGDNYLTWSSGNSLNESTTFDNASSWTIEIGENNKVDIKNVGTTTRYLQYNTGSPRFACYTNTQQKVLLFKKVANLIVEDEQTKTATQVDASDITVKENGKLTINVDADEKEIGDITVEDGGELIITGSKHIKANNVYLSATMASGKSSQMSGALAQLDIQGEVYFDITLGDNGNPEKWHAFTVPFPVDAINGIYDLDGNKLTNEVNYAIMDYHGDIRATGNYGWKKYRKTLVPGTFYLMTVDGLRTTYRFKKTADGALVAGNTKDLEEYPLNGGTEEHNDNGWNGVGNPTLRYGQVAYKVQVLNPTSYTYEPFEANETNFVVGTPFFIQADAAAASADMTFGAASGEANYAPARTPAKGIESVKVTFGNEEYKDRLYISSSEDALNRYETGKDLAKMTMTSTPKVAQIFGKAYNAKLCMVYAPMANDQAEVALELYAPQAGEYTIGAPSMDNADLYLTYEGSIIWNLSMGEYTVDLNKGTTEGYGLLLQAKAPGVATGVDNVQGDNVQCTKVVIDEHVFILRGGQMYDVTGKMVK